MTPTTQLLLSWGIGIFGGLAVAVAIGGLIGPIIGAFLAVGLKTLMLRLLAQRR